MKWFCRIEKRTERGAGSKIAAFRGDICASGVIITPGRKINSGGTFARLTNRQAAHIPGCNMALYKSALTTIGGFDAIFRKAVENPASSHVIHWEHALSPLLNGIAE